MEKSNHEEIDIQKYWLVLKRRWLIASAVFATCTSLAALSWFTQKPIYEASGELLFQANVTSSLTKVGEKIGDLESVKRESNPLETQAVVLQSAPILQEVINTLNLKDKHGRFLTPEEIPIKTETVVGTDVLKVSYTSKDPVLATKIVDQVMKSYIAHNIIFNRAEAISAGAFIKKELPRSEQELEKSIEELRQFKLHNRVIDLKDEKINTVQDISDIGKQLAKAESDYADVSAQEAAIRRRMNLPVDQAVDITSLSQVQNVQQLLSQLQKVQTQLAAERTQYTDENPTVIRLKEQEASLKGLLQKQVSQSLGYKANILPGQLQMGEVKQELTRDFVQLESQRLGLEKKIQALTQVSDAYNNRSKVIPNLEKTEEDLERKLSVAKTTYENLLARLEDTRLAESQTVGNARIVEYAKSYTSPKVQKQRFLIRVGSGFVGLLLGVGSAFFVDLIDRKVKTAKEAEALFGYTLLGLIPKFETTNASTPVDHNLEKVSPRVIVATTPRTVIHEAYQMLQANLKFISLDKKVRSIVVTSSVSGEGKSEVAANLAAVMAQAGRRVLLVDADMRQPSQHHIWDLVNSVGLSNVLVDQQELSQAARVITTNLSVLTTGVIPPNPLALIDSERMTSLIKMFAEKYDYILFDTPPIVGTADTAVLCQMVDGVLVVARPRIVDSVSVTAAKSLLSRSDANILGIVANGVNIKQEPDNYFYYNSNRYENTVETNSLPSTTR